MFQIYLDSSIYNFIILKSYLIFCWLFQILKLVINFFCSHLKIKSPYGLFSSLLFSMSLIALKFIGKFWKVIRLWGWWMQCPLRVCCDCKQGGWFHYLPVLKFMKNCCLVVSYEELLSRAHAGDLLLFQYPERFHGMLCSQLPKSFVSSAFAEPSSGLHACLPKVLNFLSEEKASPRRFF